MTREYISKLDASSRQAIGELTALVLQRYPSASFTVAPAEDDATLTHLLATVDVEDPDEVTELTIERELALLEQGVAIAVIPLRTPERTAAVRHDGERQRFSRPLPIP
jgi:hypothetical protein